MVKHTSTAQPAAGGRSERPGRKVHPERWKLANWDDLCVSLTPEQRQTVESSAEEVLEHWQWLGDRELDEKIRPLIRGLLPAAGSPVAQDLRQAVIVAATEALELTSRQLQGKRYQSAHIRHVVYDALEHSLIYGHPDGFLVAERLLEEAWALIIDRWARRWKTEARRSLDQLGSLDPDFDHVDVRIEDASATSLPDHGLVTAAISRQTDDSDPGVLASSELPPALITALAAFEAGREDIIARILNEYIIGHRGLPYWAETVFAGGDDRKFSDPDVARAIRSGDQELRWRPFLKGVISILALRKADLLEKKPVEYQVLTVQAAAVDMVLARALASSDAGRDRYTALRQHRALKRALLQASIARWSPVHAALIAADADELVTVSGTSDALQDANEVVRAQGGKAIKDDSDLRTRVLPSNLLMSGRARYADLVARYQDTHHHRNPMWHDCFTYAREAWSRLHWTPEAGVPGPNEVLEKLSRLMEIALDDTHKNWYAVREAHTGMPLKRGTEKKDVSIFDSASGLAELFVSGMAALQLYVEQVEDGAIQPSGGTGARP